MTEHSEEQLPQARARVDEAVKELDRQELVAKLCEKEGLAYASLTGEQLGPMLVTYQHKPIGEVHTTSPSALKDWHARPYKADGTLGDGTGPYVTARAAAAALIPATAEPTDGNSG
jgi:hypothetical protein